MSEGAAQGTRVPLEGCRDGDVTPNGQTVCLAEPHSPFRVELQTRQSRAWARDLVLLAGATMRARPPTAWGWWPRDGVTARPPRPPQRASADANDHSPAFPAGRCGRGELAVEDAPVGSPLLLVTWTPWTPG